MSCRTWEIEVGKVVGQLRCDDYDGTEGDGSPIVDDANGQVPASLDAPDVVERYFDSSKQPDHQDQKSEGRRRPNRLEVDPFDEADNIAGNQLALGASILITEAQGGGCFCDSRFDPLQKFFLPLGLVPWKKQCGHAQGNGEERNKGHQRRVGEGGRADGAPISDKLGYDLDPEVEEPMEEGLAFEDCGKLSPRMGLWCRNWRTTFHGLHGRRLENWTGASTAFVVFSGMEIRCGIVTISDRAFRGDYKDMGGPALRDAAKASGWIVVADRVVPDERRDIQRAIRELISTGCVLVLTTGGTGVAIRDVTPEAVLEIADREIPGFGEAMRMRSLEITPNAILSRGLAAVVGRTLVICLPGKPAGAVECFGFVQGAIPHCVKVLNEVPTSC